jgi:biopolymer transport protein ExbD
MKFLDKPPKKVSISLTPLIDVLFILIIFFTVSSTFLEQPGIELKLPDAESSESYTAQKVIVYVDKDERIFLNDNPLILENLAESVKNMISAQVDKRVILRADEKVPHGLIIKIMDSLRKKGIYKLIISTEKPI